jgi:predicted NodU family carbamoyl transferase
MADERFSDVMQQERERLNREREAVFVEQQALQEKLAEINREMTAIDAYESAKSGKQQRQTTTRTYRVPRQARSGSRREALLQVIREGGGLSRGEILERMGLKGDKSGEMSVSNALTALTKSNQLARREGKYHPA